MATGSFVAGLPCFILSYGLMEVRGSDLWLSCCFRADRYAPSASSALVCRLSRFVGSKGAHLISKKVSTQYGGSRRFLVVLKLFAVLAFTYAPCHQNPKVFDLMSPSRLEA